MGNENEKVTAAVQEERRLIQIENDLKDIKERMVRMEASLSDIITAWNTASGVVVFVKWLAGIATAVLAIVAFIKLGIK